MSKYQLQAVSFLPLPKQHNFSAIRIHYYLCFFEKRIRRRVKHISKQNLVNEFLCHYQSKLNFFSNLKRNWILKFDGKQRSEWSSYP